MIDLHPGFRLPLVYHLVKQRMLHFRPVVSPDVVSADANFPRLAGLGIYRQLTQSALHPARETDRDIAQTSTEMELVECAMQIL